MLRLLYCPRDLVFRPDLQTKTVHTFEKAKNSLTVQHGTTFKIHTTLGDVTLSGAYTSGRLMRTAVPLAYSTTTITALLSCSFSSITVTCHNKKQTNRT